MSTVFSAIAYKTGGEGNFAGRTFAPKYVRPGKIRPQTRSPNERLGPGRFNLQKFRFQTWREYALSFSNGCPLPGRPDFHDAHLSPWSPMITGPMEAKTWEDVRVAGVMYIRP